MWRTHGFLLLAISVVLFATTDDRQAGSIADGRQMIFTAVALTEAGGLGQSRGRDLNVARPQGDSVSRYGLGMTFAQVPAAALAPYVEARLGPGTSQPLFLFAPWVFVIGTAVLAGAAARELGAGRAGQALAILLSTVGSPVAAYAALEYSEPLQAFAVTGAFVASMAACRRASEDSSSSLRPAVAAGACVGVAVLTKSTLIAVAPLALFPMMAAPSDWRRRLLLGATCGFLPIGALWLYFEMARFGNPRAAYAGETFSHPFLDGLWRLLTGVNKGLFVYFPAVIAGIVDALRSARAGRAQALSRAGIVMPSIALTLIAAPWWAWHGVAGWGPRLLIPGVPLLAAAAAAEMERWPRWRATLMLIVSMAVNAPPFIQHPTAVTRYTWYCAWPTMGPTVAARLPQFARRDDNGRVTVAPEEVLATIPSASPVIVLPWFFRATTGNDPSTISIRLQSPPWTIARPDIRPSPPLTVDETRELVAAHRWNFWGREFFGVDPVELPVPLYDAALADQVLRAQEIGQPADARRLAEKLESLAPNGYADALLLECYRLLGQKQAAIGWLTGLPTERRLHPAINVVLALWDRDDGKEEEARALLQSSADHYPRTPVQAALRAPLSEWPRDLGTMTAEDGVGVPLIR